MTVASQENLMTRPIQHIGYVVDDISDAVRHWVTTFGAGPFFWLAKNVSLPDARYLGEPCLLVHSAVVGKWENNFVELIQVHEVSPPGLRDAFVGSATEPNHINHICYVVEDPEAEVERLKEVGVPRFWQASMGPMQVSYCDARAMIGHAIEIHRLTPEFEALFQVIGAAAEKWDGSDPLRELPH